MKNFYVMMMAALLISFFTGAQAQSDSQCNCDPYNCDQCACDPCNCDPCNCDPCHCDPCNGDDNKFYAEILGGANFLQTETNGGIKYDFQTGYVVSASLGYQWCYGLCLEFEYAFRRNSLRNIHFFGRSFSTHGHFQSSSYMGNLLWKLPLASWGCECWGIQPYFGAGIGYDCQQLHASDVGFIISESRKHFSWQVIGGLSYQIFCNTEISLDYKFHKGGFNYVNNNSLGVGLTYKFDPM